MNDNYSNYFLPVEKSLSSKVFSNSNRNGAPLNNLNDLNDLNRNTLNLTNQNDSTKNTPSFNNLNNFNYFEKNEFCFNFNDDANLNKDVTPNHQKSNCNENNNDFSLIENKKKTEVCSNKNVSSYIESEKHKLDNLNFLSDQKEKDYNHTTKEINLLSITNEVRKDKQFNIDLLDVGDETIKAQKLLVDKNSNKNNDGYFFEREEFKNINLFGDFNHDNDLILFGYFSFIKK